MASLAPQQSTGKGGEKTAFLPHTKAGKGKKKSIKWGRSHSKSTYSLGIMRTFCVEHLKALLMHWQLLIQVPRKGKVTWAQLQQLTVHVLLRPNYVCHRSHKPGQGVRFVAVHPAKHQLQEKEKARPLQWGLCRITISTVSFTLEFLGEEEKGWEGIQRLESDSEKEMSSTGDKREILKHRGKMRIANGEAGK